METIIQNSSTQALPNPFPGLRPFNPNESHLYFGRDQQVHEVINKLKTNRFVAVIGTSGIGKSSFMYCGLFPALKAQHHREPTGTWEIFSLRPGEAPIKNLAEALTGTKESHDVYQHLCAYPEGLVDLLRKQKEQETDPKQYLIFLDQFEELFRFKSADTQHHETSDAFVNLLCEALQQEEVPIYIVLTMRSDFIGNCSQYPHLTRYINHSQFLIPYMTREEKKAAIVGPIQVIGANIEEDLVERILDSIGDTPDQLPLMQHALMRTWDAWSQSTDDTIQIRHYERIGGIQKALSIHADEAFNELNDPQKEICAKVFKAITEITKEGRKIRRPTRLGQIAAIVNTEVQEVKEIVDLFRRADRGLLTPPMHIHLEAETMVDISHESLISNWGTLRKWVEEEADSVKTYLRLAEAAEMHQQGKSGLWRPPELDLALSWREEQQPAKAWGIRYHPTYERTMLFLDSSKREYEAELDNKEKQQKRRLAQARFIAVILFLGAIIAGIFGFYAYFQSQEAQKQAERAKKQEVIALEKSEEAQRQALIAEKQRKLALEKSDEAARQEKLARLEAERAKKQEEIANAQRAIAITASQKAEKEARIAKLNSQLAEIEKEIAEIAERKAKEANQRAFSLRMLSIANAMAIKSKEMEDSVQRKALVAKQAYIFHTENNGQENDPDIYNGLYYALKALRSKDSSYNQLIGHSANVRTVAPYWDRQIFSAGSDGKIMLWDTHTRVTLGMLDQPGLIHRTLAVNQDRTRVACAGNYPRIQIIQTEGLQVERTLPVSSDQVWYMAFGDHNQLVTAEQNGVVSVWDLNTNLDRPVQRTDPHQGIINAVAVSGQKIAVARGQEVQMFDLSDLSQAGTFYRDPSREIVSLAFSQDGRLALGNSEGVVKIFWVNTKMMQGNELKGHKARVNNLIFTQDNQRLATASWDKTVRIWNVATAKSLDAPPIILNDHEDWVWSLTFSPDGKKLLAGCKNALFRVWPTQVSEMAASICPDPELRRNLTLKEWERFVAPIDEVEYERTCSDKPYPPEWQNLKQTSNPNVQKTE